MGGKLPIYMQESCSWVSSLREQRTDVKFVMSVEVAPMETIDGLLKGSVFIHASGGQSGGSLVMMVLSGRRMVL